MFKVQDHYFKKAKQEGHLARSFYKLDEINNKFRLINSNQKILDCGYAPGSWSEFISKKIGPQGILCAVDIKSPTHAFGPNVKVFQKDIRDIHQLIDLEMEDAFHLIVSDMAPNTIGIDTVDQMQQLELVQWVFNLIPVFLKKNGHLIVKVFESKDSQDFLRSQKVHFKKTDYFRPKSIRASSREVYWIGQNYG